MGSSVGDNRHAWCAVHRRAIGVVRAVRVAGIGGFKSGFGLKVRLWEGGVDHLCRERHTVIHVCIEAILVIEARAIFIPHTVVDRQSWCGPPMVFSVYMVLRIHTVNVSRDIVITRVIRKAQQEVSEVNSGKRTDGVAYIAKVEISIVIARGYPGSSNVGVGANIATELHRMDALGPRRAFAIGVGVIDIDTVESSRRRRGQIRKGNIWEAVVP